MIILQDFSDRGYNSILTEGGGSTVMACLDSDMIWMLFYVAMFSMLRLIINNFKVLKSRKFENVVFF